MAFNFSFSFSLQSSVSVSVPLGLPHFKGESFEALARTGTHLTNATLSFARKILSQRQITFNLILCIAERPFSNWPFGYLTPATRFRVSLSGLSIWRIEAFSYPSGDPGASHGRDTARTRHATAHITDDKVEHSSARFNAPLYTRSYLSASPFCPRFNQQAAIDAIHLYTAYAGRTFNLLKNL